MLFKGTETPDEIIEIVKGKIAAMPNGLREAFAHNERIQLYSGPCYAYRHLLIGPDFQSDRDGAKESKSSNGQRATKQAKEKGWNATLLDDTAIGKFLFQENNLYNHLNKLYHNRRLVDEAGQKIMNFVSALFIRTAHGDIKTAVCGADRTRVFYVTEMEGLHSRTAYPSEADFLVSRLLDNKDITSINGTPIDVFRKLRDERGKESVYNYICETELKDRHEHALKTGKRADYADYLDRLELYRTDIAERVYAKNADCSSSERISRISTSKKSASDYQAPVP